MSVIERITQTLEDKHLDQSNLCKVLGIRDSTFSTWKTRKTDPPAKYLLLICEFLNVPVDYLLGRTDNPDTSVAVDKNNEMTTELLKKFQALSFDDKIDVLNIVIEKSRK